MSYNKYIKYKNKYLQLKMKMKGGNNEVFTIYTTGILDWNNESILIDQFDLIKNRIISILPPTIKIINIRHFDPETETPTNEYDEEKRHRFLRNKTRLTYDLEQNDKLIFSRFSNENFNLGEVYSLLNDSTIYKEAHKNYIILDFAHLFIYDKYLLHHVYSDILGFDGELNVFYPGYIGEEQPKEYCRNISNLTLLQFPKLIYYDNNELKTYVDFFIEKGIEFNEHTPEDTFYNKLMEKRQEIYQTNRTKQTERRQTPLEFDREFEINCRDLYDDIVRDLLK